MSIYRLANETFIGCRPISPADRGKLVAAFGHLSPASPYRRSFSATPRLTTAAQLDGIRGPIEAFARWGRDRARRVWLGAA